MPSTELGTTIYQQKLLTFKLPRALSQTPSRPSRRTVSIHVDGFLSQPSIVNVGASQGCVLVPTLFLLFINDLLSSTSSPVRAFEDDATLHCSFYYRNSRRPNTNIDRSRSVVSVSLNSDSERISESASRPGSLSKCSY